MTKAIKNIVFSVLLIISFILCSTCIVVNCNVVYASSDTTAPVIKSVTMDKTEVHPGESVTFTAEITDETDVVNAGIVLSGTGTTHIVVLKHKEGDIYEGKFEVTDSTPEVEYRTSFAYAEDSLRHYDQNFSFSYVFTVKPHTYGDWTITKEATCIEYGSKEKKCTKCGAVVTEPIPLSNHTWNTKPTVDKAATCTEEGSQSIHCSVCGEKDESTVTKISASGHKWNPDYTVDKKATYTAAGSKSIHCSTCNVQKPGSTVSIPKLKVTTPTVSKPTAIKKGFTIKWKKVSGVNGYEIQYALNSKFTKGKKAVKITKGTTVSKKITKLKAKKKYYVRVRTYKTVSGKRYYSAWCKTKTVTTKK